MKGEKNLIGDRLRLARLMENPKATQSDISARLQVIGISLSDIQLVALAKALKVSTSWLLGES